MARYQDGRGWLYEVHAGIGGWHCVRSKNLPWRDTPAEAEADLQAYAKKKDLIKEEKS